MSDVVRAGSLSVGEPQVSEQQVIDAFADVPRLAVVRRIPGGQQPEAKRRTTILGR